MSRKSLKRQRGADRVVRRIKPDGTLVEYRYPAWKPSADHRPPIDLEGSLGAVMAKWQGSPEWRRLKRSTQDLYVRAMLSLSSMQNVPVEKVTWPILADIRDAIELKRGPGAARAFTVGCSALFAFAKQRRLIDTSPASGLAKNLEVGELPAWTEEEYLLAIRHLPEHYRRVVVLARYTGQRRGDLIKMKWSDYDGSYIHVVQEKTEVELDLPVAPQLKAELDSWRASLPEPVVVTVKGKPYDDQPILVRAGGTHWDARNLSSLLGCALAKVPGFPAGKNLHGLRKLTATTLAMEGASVHEIQSITGHKTLAMVQHYTRGVDQKKLADRVAHLLEIKKKGNG